MLITHEVQEAMPELPGEDDVKTLLQYIKRRSLNATDQGSDGIGIVDPSKDWNENQNR